MPKSLIPLMALTSLAAFAADAPKPTPELLQKGQATYAKYCFACHGEKGVGDGPGAVALNPKPRDFTKEPFKQGEKPQELFKTISEGVPTTPMVGYAHIPEDERWGLVYHVLQLKSPGKDLAAAAAPAPAAAPAAKPEPAKKDPKKDAKKK